MSLFLVIGGYSRGADTQRICGPLSESSHDRGAEAVQRGPHNRAHEKKFKESRRSKETAVRLGMSQKAHEFWLKVCGVTKIAERARIVCTVIGRENVVFGTSIMHEFQNYRPWQKLLGNNVCENQVVPRIRRVHQERPSWRENTGHLLKHRRWLRQMLKHHVAGNQIEAGVWEGQRDQG